VVRHDPSVIGPSIVIGQRVAPSIGEDTLQLADADVVFRWAFAALAGLLPM